MGMLQDNKSRKKISNDPNNTKWTRDTTTFGQKILRSQGWQPGQFLGAQDAPHAALHSAASASYIRVVLKDDMKGLGFDRAKEDEVTGLDVFSDVLSRLNGKSDAAVQEDRDARLAIKTHRYVEMRWGPMRFVRGGLLVGDKLKEVLVVEGSGDSSSEANRMKRDKKSKKRKAEEEQEDSEAAAAAKKEKKRRCKDGDEAEKKKKKKKRGKEEKDKTTKKAKEASKLKDGSDDDDDDDKAARKKAKKEKKERKRERREKKEEKKRRKAAAESSGSSSDDDDDDDESDEDASRSATVTPAATSGTSTPLGNRNFVRSRYIAQKRQAVMDATALKQIFMVKA